MAVKSVYTPHPDYTGFRYNGPSYTGQTALCKGNLFLPDDPPPSDGYPCVIAPVLSGWVVTWLLNQISDSPSDSTNEPWLKKFLDNGIAVVWFSTTVARSWQTAQDANYNVPHTDTVIDIDQLATVQSNTNRYGAAYTGNGIMHHHRETMPGDYDGGTHPYARGDWPMAMKDCVAMLQYCVANAAPMQINPRKFIAYGYSAAAHSLWNVASNEDLAAATWPSGTGQETIATNGRFIARVFGGNPMWFRQMPQNLNNVYDFLATPGPTDPGGIDYDNYDVNALLLSHDPDSLGFDAFGASDETQDANSPLEWITATAGIQTANQQIPTYLWTAAAADTGVVQPFDKTNVDGEEVDFHSVWFQACISKALNINGGNVRSVVATQAVYDSLDATVPFLEYVYPDAIVATADQPQDMMEWLGGAVGGKTREVLGGSSDPVTFVTDGAATFSNGTTSATPFTAWTQVFAENLSRKMGVWLQITEGSLDVAVVRPQNADPGAGTTIGFKLSSAYECVSTEGNMDVFFIPGTDAVWLKDESETAELDYVAMEY